MSVETNELLHRIVAVLQVMSYKMDRLIELGERIEATGHDADVSNPVAEKLPERWRRLEAEEVIRSGDWCNSLRNNQDANPPDGGWIPARHWGKKVFEMVGLAFVRPVADEPAKEEPDEPQYREPVLPADLGKLAEFSQDGNTWSRWKLCGCYRDADDQPISWQSANIGFRHCRIKKDA